jgi:hypothetical protein
MKKMMSVRWFRVGTVLGLTSAVGLAIALLPATGLWGAALLLVLISSVSLRLAWTAASRPMTDIIAGVEAEPRAVPVLHVAPRRSGS